MAKFRITSFNIDETVEAPNHIEALYTLKNRPAEDFGLIVEAQEVGSETEHYVVRTGVLMQWWDREDIARIAAEQSVKRGLGESVESLIFEDKVAAGNLQKLMEAARG